jgi:hypothetical protein
VRTSTRTRQYLSFPVQDIKKPIYEIGIGFGDVFRIGRIDFTYRLNQPKVTKSPFSVSLMAFLFSY